MRWGLLPIRSLLDLVLFFPIRSGATTSLRERQGVRLNCSYHRRGLGGFAGGDTWTHIELYARPIWNKGLDLWQLSGKQKLMLWRQGFVSIWNDRYIFPPARSVFSILLLKYTVCCAGRALELHALFNIFSVNVIEILSCPFEALSSELRE